MLMAKRIFPPSIKGLEQTRELLRRTFRVDLKYAWRMEK